MASAVSGIPQPSYYFRPEKPCFSGCYDLLRPGRFENPSLCVGKGHPESCAQAVTRPAILPSLPNPRAPAAAQPETWQLQHSSGFTRLRPTKSIILQRQSFLDPPPPYRAGIHEIRSWNARKPDMRNNGILFYPICPDCN